MHQGRTSPPASPERLAMAGRTFWLRRTLVRRSLKAAENAAQRKKGHFRMEAS